MLKIDIDEWFNLINELCNEVNFTKYSGVYGVPRGGTLLAIEISKRADIPLLDIPEENCVVVDDLIDSGRTKEKYIKKYDFYALIDKRTESNKEWIEFWYEETEKDNEDLIIRILEHIGEDPTRAGLIGTPDRVIRMWKEIFRGYNESKKPKITTFNNGADGITYDEMIMDSGNFYSHCEHHMVPFFGEYYFAYIPDKTILGLSKVARIVDYYSAKLQIQERLVKEILDELEKAVKPKGIALVMKGEHLCKTMRGAKKKGQMITSDLRGVFKSNPETRAEFMNMVK